MKTISSIHKNSVANFVENLSIKLNYLPIPENVFWDAANVLLDTNAIKSLVIRDAKALVRILENLQEPKQIEGFIEDLSEKNDIDIKGLEKELKTKKLDGTKIGNLRTLTSKIFKRKPKDLSFYERILANHDNINVFKDQCISVSNQDYSIMVNVRIKSAVFQENQDQKIALFELVSQGVTHKISLDLSAGYVNSASIVREPYKPLGEILRGKIMRKYNKGEVMLKDLQIAADEKQIGVDTAVIPNGSYDVIRGSGFVVDSGYHIIFKEKKTNKEIIFEVYLENKKEYNIVHKYSQHSMDFSKFCSCFKALCREEYGVEYKNKTDSETLVCIKKGTENDDTMDILEKMQMINQEKSQLIHRMQSDCSEIFFVLLYNLIKNQGISISADLIQEQLKTARGGSMDIALDMLIQINKEIGIRQTKESLLMDILTEANYSLLVNKKGTIDTVRILTLLSEADQHAQLMKDKDIVAFTGSTGCGKSTTVDYFMGIPMEKFTNNFGDVVVRINQEEYNEIIEEREIKEITSSKIGHSIGTSETIYSQGHAFIKDSLSENIESLCNNVILCDNPGFNDTGGSIYEICTNLSIDQAIQNCKSIKALVLIVPYQAIILDIANPLIQLVALLQERFPDLLQEQSSTNRCFHILITKWISHKQIDGFRDRMQKHLSEERELIEKLQKEQSSISQNDIDRCRDRLKIFTSLLKMKDTERIKFINVEDSIEKNEILARYLAGKESISKDSYVKAFDGSDMQTAFSNQISTSADTWTNHILLPYFEQIPQKIDQDRKSIESYKQSIEECKISIVALQNSSIVSENKIQEADKDLNIYI